MNYAFNAHYLDRYLRFIASCKVVPGEYVERHHIYPQSMFPRLAKLKTNLIALSGRQHFIAHWMLHKAFGGAMTLAFHKMRSSSGDMERYWNLNSAAYEKLRISFGKAISNAKLGKPLSSEARKNMSASRLGKPLPLAQRMAIGAGNTGRLVSDGTRKRISEAKKGVKRPPMSDEHRKNLSAPKKRGNCKYCGKSISLNLIDRWHNDNCKLKEAA